VAKAPKDANKPYDYVATRLKGLAEKKAKAEKEKKPDK
jgi:hypothetical protein